MKNPLKRTCELLLQPQNKEALELIKGGNGTLKEINGSDGIAPNGTVKDINGGDGLAVAFLADPLLFSIFFPVSY